MEEASRGSLWTGLLGLVLSGAMVVLTVTLARSCAQGTQVIGALVASVKAGAPVSEGVGGAEAPTLTELLRGSRSSSVRNFQGQAGTSCYWLEFSGPGGATEVRFVLGGDDTRVTAISARRECDCPIDADLPCRLVD